MNRLLASTLELLNILLAVVIVLVCVSFFSGIGLTLGFSPFLSLLLSVIAGVVIAGVVCGLIAMIALIEDHLRTIAENVGMGGSPLNRRREPVVDLNETRR